MPITNTLPIYSKPSSLPSAQRGVSLIELIVFLVVVSIAFTVLMSVYVQSGRNNVDPIIQLRLLEAAQSRLDEVIALKYDNATPTGGIPACNSSASGAIPCTNAADGNLNPDAVDDYHGVSDTLYSNYQRSVRVTTEGNRKLITVSVAAPSGQRVELSAYRYNF